MTAEEWRPIPTAPGYEASSLGRIKSVAKGPGRKVGRIMSQNPNGRGLYPKVDLTSGGKRISRPVHRLVGAAFLGPIPEGLETRHLNGDGFDNRLANLKYGTHTENMQDSIAHGTHVSLRMKARTRCNKGHEYTEANTWRTPSGSRICRRCSIDRTIAGQKRNLARREANGEVTPHIIREWAKSQGINVAPEGRLSNELKNAFAAHHGGWTPAPSFYPKTRKSRIETRAQRAA